MKEKYNLTEQQTNLVKDILKFIGCDDELNAQLAEAIGMTDETFTKIADEVFINLGNGRIVEAK